MRANRQAEDIVKEQDIINNIRKMGAQSLPPDEFEQLENIIEFLKRNRKTLREGEDSAAQLCGGLVLFQEWAIKEREEMEGLTEAIDYENVAPHMWGQLDMISKVENKIIELQLPKGEG